MNGVNPGSAYGNGFSFPGQSRERQQGVAIVYARTLTQNMVLELKMGYMRSAIDSGALNSSSSLSSSLRFSGVAVAGDSDTAGIPMILGQANVFDENPGDSDGEGAAYSGLGDAGYLPLLQYDNSFQYVGSLSSAHKEHSFKFGGGFIRRQAKIGQSPAGRGAFGFGNTASASFCGDSTGCTGKYLGDLVLGDAQ